MRFRDNTDEQQWIEHMDMDLWLDQSDHVYLYHCARIIQDAHILVYHANLPLPF